MYISIPSCLISREDVGLVLNVLLKTSVLKFFTCSLKKYALSMHICLQQEKMKINKYLPKSALGSMFLGIISKKTKGKDFV